MPKIKCRVARITQEPRQADDGSTAFTTTVKLTPVNLYGGDILLRFSNAEVVFHPQHELRDEKQPRNVLKTMIGEKSLITRAVCYVEGEEAVTFQAAVPEHPGHSDLGINPLPGTDAPIVELTFG